MVGARKSLCDSCQNYMASTLSAIKEIPVSLCYPISMPLLPWIFINLGWYLEHIMFYLIAIIKHLKFYDPHARSTSKLLNSLLHSTVATPEIFYKIKCGFYLRKDITLIIEDNIRFHSFQNQVYSPTGHWFAGEVDRTLNHLPLFHYKCGPPHHNDTSKCAEEGCKLQKILVESLLLGPAP